MKLCEIVVCMGTKLETTHGKQILFTFFFFSFLAASICGDKCIRPNDDCICGGTNIQWDIQWREEFCCIPSNANCTKIGHEQVNCPSGISLTFEQKCNNQCATSTENMIAISSIHDNTDRCSKDDTFSKVSRPTEIENFAKYCGRRGEICGPSSSSVSFKQCYSTS